jgi:hypothetical protein
MITLFPPDDGTRPFKKITLHSGLTIFPDREDGGRVEVADRADADELIAEGWRLDETSKIRRFVEDDLLQKGFTAQLRRTPGVGLPTVQKSKPPSDSELLRRGLARQLEREPHSTGSADTRIEFGEVDAGKHGRIRMALNQGAGFVALHGVHADVAELDRDLRGALFATSGHFNMAETQEEQTSARAAVGAVVAAVLDRHPWLEAKVREAKLRERYDN